MQTGARREKVELRAESEVWEAFYQECSELLESIDRGILQLEQSDQPKQVLASLL